MLIQSHDGAIHLLPALPDAWKEGEIKGLKTRGGFEVDMQWRNGEFSKATVKSSLGGNCRIRSYIQLKGKGLVEAKGENPNSLFTLSQTKQPLRHSEKPLDPLLLKNIYEYDVTIKKGDVLQVRKL
jgi:alpha-L-fucosidase 2